MAHVIAMAGKGGVGKTTLTGILIQEMCRAKKGPILAVDADANSNLNEVLGVEVDYTLGDIREEIAQAEMQVRRIMRKSNLPLLWWRKTILICLSWAEPRAKAATVM